jgi:preprotein translocase subunit SecG
MFLFLTIVQAIVAAALVGIILMQRSEGGGLGIGGSPTGLMSARGAADFMTRTTRILAVLFVVLSIALAAIAAGKSSSSGELTTTLERDVAPEPAAPAQPAPAQPAPADDDPLADVTG